MSRTVNSIIRLYSRVSRTTRPSFDHVFPKAKTIKSILFELDSKHTYSKLLPVYKWNYEHMDDESPRELDAKSSKGISSNDYMLMKKVLERIRKDTKSANKNLLALENALLDKAVDMGNEDAIAIISFDTLKNPENNDVVDVEYANKLVKNLYENSHPLTIKLTGDLLMKAGDDKLAEKNYMKFIKMQDNTALAGEVYGYLGRIHLRKPDIHKAEEYFRKSIKYSRLENAVFSYYYLSQIYIDTNPLRARSYLEVSATQGFKEAFKSLGYLEMKYFDDIDKAYEWFRLGVELNDLESYFGFFDCNVKLKEWSSAKKCLNALNQLSKTSDTTKQLVEKFISQRKDIVSTLDTKLATKNSISSGHSKSQTPAKDNTSDRWSV
ncbi:hypothetical protein TPHA_0C04640 [Tetrapisispora phaffii CBS 4417]|uniref:Uncharacterized protein n=1 Tax=Tetrapisispora phaffii (strain ATCC 24235 / CBS 4417 / NBRC 1672 / NRRL Y-8282 / UCD 70-5) TaxID=1071381 RepID=G8BQV2_TETPH|nr:hypothetical protein TPHA_0C04640 [Tetrapisispora phaffii CBS 4417]CCE62614.1 hypothetical protein TPHA_0C04640 [Tetrapisispora phaffii CBS 4417]